MATWQQIARADALRYGINPVVFLRQIMQESGGNPRARSSAGAEGIAQFMPGTAAGMHVNPWNVQSALAGAARMDAQNLHRFGSYEKMLAAYNAGSGAVESGAWRGYGQTTNYVRSILSGVHNPNSFARGTAAAGAGGGGSTGGGGAAAARALAMIGLAGQSPIQVNVPLRQTPTALDTIQTMLAAHGDLQQQQPLSAGLGPEPMITPPSHLSGELAAIHTRLLPS